MFCCALLYVHSSFAIIVMGKRELVASLWSRECCVALPHDATGLSAVCDCGISYSYSLSFFKQGGIVLLRSSALASARTHTKSLV